MLTTVFLGFVLAWASYSDLRIREIPDAVPLGLMVCAVVGIMLGVYELTLNLAWAGLFIGSGLLILVSLFGAMGGGDIKLMGALGMWFGPLKIVDVFLLSLVFGSIVACAYATKYRKPKTAVPFGPAIAVAAMTAWSTGFSFIG